MHKLFPVLFYSLFMFKIFEDGIKFSIVFQDILSDYCRRSSNP